MFAYLNVIMKAILESIKIFIFLYCLLEEREVLLTNTFRNFLENGRSASGEESSEELKSSGLIPSLSCL